MITNPKNKPFVMFEEDWLKLCVKQCRARRKQYGGTREACIAENDCGVCPECFDDAALRVPAQYHTDKQIADAHDPLPGASRR